MTVPIKYVRLIIFENYNECKIKHVFYEKVITRFDKKNGHDGKAALIKGRIYYTVP